MSNLNLRGGLGNQIIQIGTALNKNKKFNINTAAYDLNPILDGYNTDCFQSEILEKVGLAFRFLISKFRGARSDFDSMGVMDGYFQAGIQSDIISTSFFKYLSSKLNIDIERANQYDLVIHFRGGDYLDPVNKRIFELIDETYYKSALKELIENVNVDGFKVQVITNDVQSAKNVFSGFFFDELQISSSSELDDFCTLIKAPYAIIPNSTFSLTARILAIKFGYDRGTYFPMTWFTKSSKMLGPKINEFKPI